MTVEIKTGSKYCLIHRIFFQWGLMVSFAGVVGEEENNLSTLYQWCASIFMKSVS